jgi:hypothetical protein
LDLSVDPDAGQPVEAHQLDQVPDLRLGPVQKKFAIPAAQAIREHRQVDHQGRIGEVKVAEIDQDIGLSAKSEHERAPAKALGTPILVSCAKQHRRVVGEL